MQSARALQFDITSAPPAPSPAPAAEYILIGPSLTSLHEVAQAFAELEQPPSKRPWTSDPDQTLELPTTRIRIWDRPDGRRQVEVQDHRGESATVVFKRTHLFAR